MSKQWPMERVSTRMPRAPKSDGLVVETVNRLELQDVAGVLLGSTARCMPVSQALVGEEYEARILFHQQRVEREMQQLDLVERGLRKRGRTTTAEGTRAASEHKNLPRGLKYSDLKIVTCARCSRTLLGESQESLRAIAIAKKLRTAANFPPPVSARLHGGRPYCGACAAWYAEEGPCD